MIDSFVRVEEAKHRAVIQKIIKALLVYSCLVVCLGLYVVYEFSGLKKSKLLLQGAQASLRSSSRKLVAANAATNKMQIFLHNARLEEKKDLSSHIKIAKHTINSLASRYKIVTPVELKVSVPANRRVSAIPSIDLAILVKARNDESITRFIDSLVTSLTGFVKIEKLAMAKLPLQQASSSRTNDLVACEIKLSWYVLAKR